MDDNSVVQYEIFKNDGYSFMCDQKYFKENFYKKSDKYIKSKGIVRINKIEIRVMSYSIPVYISKQLKEDK